MTRDPRDHPKMFHRKETAVYLYDQQLARLHSQDMLRSAQQERLVRRALRQRRAARLARRASGLAQAATVWSEQQVALAR